MHRIDQLPKRQSGLAHLDDLQTHQHPCFDVKGLDGSTECSRPQKVHDLVATRNEVVHADGKVLCLLKPSVAPSAGACANNEVLHLVLNHEATK